MTDTDSDVAKVAKLTKDIRIGMMTTVGPDGHFVSRPMAQQEVEFDGDLWFFAERNSRKVQHITANPQVNVSTSASSSWVSLTGHAVVLRHVSPWGWSPVERRPISSG